METDELVTLVSDTDQVLGQMEKHLAHRLNKKHRAFCSVFFITLSRKRKRELPPGSDAIADFKFQKNSYVRTIAIPSLRSLQIFSLRPY